MGPFAAQIARMAHSSFAEPVCTILPLLSQLLDISNMQSKNFLDYVVMLIFCIGLHAASGHIVCCCIKLPWSKKMWKRCFKQGTISLFCLNCRGEPMATPLSHTFLVKDQNQNWWNNQKSQRKRKHKTWNKKKEKIKCNSLFGWESW